MPTHERSSLSQRAVAAAFYGFKAFMVMGVSECCVDPLPTAPIASRFGDYDYLEFWWAADLQYK